MTDVQNTITEAYQAVHNGAKRVEMICTLSLNPLVQKKIVAYQMPNVIRIDIKEV